MVIFETKALKVFYTERSSDFLWITFAPQYLAQHQEAAYLASLGAENKFSQLGFVATKPNWYPEADMKKALKAIQPILRKFPEKICLGHSMGGFAALRYAKLLKSDVTIAISPQYSVHIKDVPPELQETVQQQLISLEAAPATLDKNMRITAAAAHGHAYVLYDSLATPEVMQVELIEKNYPLTRIPIPHASRHEQHFLKEAPAIARLLELCRTNDIQGLNAFAQARPQKLSPLRAFDVGMKLSDRHVRWGMALHDRYAPNNKAKNYVPFANRIARIALRNGYTEWAMAVARQILARQETNAMALQLLADAYIKQNDLNQAIHLLQQLVALEPQKVWNRERLIITLLRVPDITAARAEANAALQAFPEHPGLLHRASEVARMEGNLEEAIAHQRKSLSLAAVPSPVLSSLRLARLLLKAGELEEASSLFTQILQTDSPNARNLHAAAQSGLVDIEIQRKNLPEAIRLQRKTIELEPTEPYSYNRLLLLLVRTGDLATAQAEAKLALQLHPGHEALLNRAREIEQMLNPPVQSKEEATQS